MIKGAFFQEQITGENHAVFLANSLNIVAEGGKSDRHAESCQGSRCLERNDRQRYEARHLMDGWILNITMG